MHCCGDLIHDTFVNIGIILPFLSSLMLWFRTRMGIRCKNKKCEDVHTHPEDKHEDINC